MKVLVAEDDPISAEALRSLLTNLKYDVTLTRNGAEAWQKLQADDYPIVILDWMMPEMDGLEVCRNIRAKLSGPYRCIIMLTAKQDRDDRAPALNAGVDVFLTKPLECAMLTARLQVAERILKLER